jgi:hypothetical protein
VRLEYEAEIFQTTTKKDFFNKICHKQKFIEAENTSAGCQKSKPINTVAETAAERMIARAAQS